MKPWYTSWTIWVNIVTLLTLALALPEVAAIIPASVVPYIAALNATANLALRYFKTNQPLA